MPDSAHVTALSLTPVKAMQIRTVEVIELDEHGARGDRRFYVIDARGRMVNGKQHALLQTIVADHDPAAGRLTLTFPDGSVADGTVEHGPTVAARFYHRADEVPELRGPWSEAVSTFVGAPLRLVESPSGVDRGRAGAASLISAASLRRLAQQAGGDELDARRFRMLIQIDGVSAHAEDRWVGRRVRVGDALLRAYRGGEDSTEPLPFGVHGEVLEGGTVRIGDVVTVDGDGPDDV